MPEGDTIFRIARALEAALTGSTVTELRLLHSGAEVPNLVGAHITQVQARGKHLLIYFSRGWVLHTHLKMNGSWRIYPGTSAVPVSPYNTSVLLRTDSHLAIARRAPLVRFVRQEQLGTDPFLSTLGPDLLAPQGFDAERALRELRKRNSQEIGVALLDQRALAGIGNVYKSELLYLEQFAPRAALSSFSDAQLRGLLERARVALLQNVAEIPRGSSSGGHYRYTRSLRDPRDRSRSALFVYGRLHDACERCGAPIKRLYQGSPARSTYYCPQCQRLDPSQVANTPAVATPPRREKILQVQPKPTAPPQPTESAAEPHSRAGATLAENLPSVSSATPRDNAGIEPALDGFHPATRDWFRHTFTAPTEAQRRAWPEIQAGRSVLLLAPTGSGKTLAAFQSALDRLLFEPKPGKARCQVLYVSPLKALTVDIDRNLRGPLAGLVRHAEQLGLNVTLPRIGLRTGDTPARERVRMLREPPEILITTPESLFLLLTSRAREILNGVETVIIDEIHALAGTKRGAHLFLSLERLEALRDNKTPLKRIGLSATQRPLDEIARLLGGFQVQGSRVEPRPVTVVDASVPKALELRLELPNASSVGEIIPTVDTGPDAARHSLWTYIYPRLVELVRAHRTTMVFVNSRRLAERVANAINEQAGEILAQAHHGSLAREQREAIEERLKLGHLPCIVATSSLELGLDLGAVELVVQIEAPPSIAAGLQRVGRANHDVGGVSRGVLFPKHRGDLLCSTTALAKMREGAVEATRYPRLPLDVLAQQIVACVAIEELSVDTLFDRVRGAAAFAELARPIFEGVLDMLAGRYPSDEFAELRPRIVWDRVRGVLRPSSGAQRLAVVNAGTIPDRGLYGVFLASDVDEKSHRVGELDEEMVYETRTGDVILLGASSWRVAEITHDRVLVSPAPGVPGKMPFWRGDGLGRAAELGKAVGKMARELAQLTPSARHNRLSALGLDEAAITSLGSYLDEQVESTGEVPSDETLIFERSVDELGDYRLCLLSPYGGRIHAALATAIRHRALEELAIDVEAVYSDDGIVLRFPESEKPPDPISLLPDPDAVEDLLVRALGNTALFAAHFRECAARALLLPRRYPGKRSPLWAQRKRAQDLLAVASRYSSFPILLETYRECLQDVFDVPELISLLRRIRARSVKLRVVDAQTPSPFATSLLFGYAGNFIYEQDAPLAERRAQALSVDHNELRVLLGASELRELFDADIIADLEQILQRKNGRFRPKNADDLHDLLLSLGDLSKAELSERTQGNHSIPPELLEQWLVTALAERRILETRVAGEPRYIAVEDAARYRDGLGSPLPRGVPQAFLEPVADALGQLLGRYARTHTPFPASEAARRFGIAETACEQSATGLVQLGRLVRGEFLPHGQGAEYCDLDVLRQLKRRTLAALRKKVAPVEPHIFARFALEWHGLQKPGRGTEALLGAIEQLQGLALPAVALEREILAARVQGYQSGDLDPLLSTGEVIWRGLESLGEHSGRIALYLSDRYPLLGAAPGKPEGELQTRIYSVLKQYGASFYADLQRRIGGLPQDLVDALWNLVWTGVVTNDTLAPLRSLSYAHAQSKRAARGRPNRVRERRLGPAGSEGRWSLVQDPTDFGVNATDTERLRAQTELLLQRQGIVTRQGILAEGLVGGFSAIYPLLKAMEEAGRIRRGYFVAGLGGLQFALPGAADRLREQAERDPETQAQILAATDPANPYGAALAWPESQTRQAARPQRADGATVILRNGRLIGWLGRTERALLTWLAENEPERAHDITALARALASRAEARARGALLLVSIDQEKPDLSAVAAALREQGFSPGQRGYLKRARA